MSIVTKICSKCGEEKGIDRFCKDHRYKDGMYCYCKTCQCEISKEQYRKNPEKYIEIKKQWCKNNPDKVKKQYVQYSSTHKDEKREHNKQYSLTHKKEINQHRKLRHANLYKSDVNYKLRCVCSSRVRLALQRNSKSSSTMKLIGCSIIFLKSYIEKQFLLGMSWSNWGEGVGKWNIDHIIPCSFFIMSDPVEQHMCFHYSNLRPLWWKDNIKKSNKIINIGENNCA